ncbi:MULTISPECIES: AbrB/MazE/SpoVT family DNA-binding domain-containing protein [Metallosphaera]|uniref:AbrB/MazE/SpoVT family DNA-binding domain-containing protein n=1 Tax=Metallosphaera prunae TaxID=47304 RepID=A0A4D8RVS6_METPR|nr:MULTISPECIES: AbrB/MazE/SpoVT family DNA-binding domain-containing protein [Metallosphaera]QCO29107.1 AbrB/MazE/SpoVT family DNA-binding domain-containing protein [Metallosphaera prunae]BBL47315.1 hypothetical protein MJ1HA_1416 [Metallosphaera sedula]
MEVKVHKKGIVVIPQSIRQELGIREGSRLELEVKDGVIILRPKVSLLDAFGVDEREKGLEVLRLIQEGRANEGKGQP